MFYFCLFPILRPYFQIGKKDTMMISHFDIFTHAIQQRYNVDVLDGFPMKEPIVESVINQSELSSDSVIWAVVLIGCKSTLHVYLQPVTFRTNNMFNLKNHWNTLFRKLRNFASPSQMFKSFYSHSDGLYDVSPWKKLISAFLSFCSFKNFTYGEI